MKMKRMILAVFISAISSIALQAQRQNISFGPTAGFGNAWWSDNPSSKYKPAGNVGLALVYSSLPHIGFGADLKFSIEGARSKVGSVESESTLNYLRVPLKVIYFFGEYGDRLRPKLAAGPSFGFLVGGKREITQSNEQVTTAKSTDLYKGFDAGLGVLAGLNYRLVKNTWFTGEVNYYNGFTNISEATNANVKNRNLGINIGVTFGIGTATK